MKPGRTFSWKLLSPEANGQKGFVEGFPLASDASLEFHSRQIQAFYSKLCSLALFLPYPNASAVQERIKGRKVSKTFKENSTYLE